MVKTRLFQHSMSTSKIYRSKLKAGRKGSSFVFNEGGGTEVVTEGGEG